MKIINKRTDIYKEQIFKLWIHFKKTIELKFLLERIPFEKILDNQNAKKLFPNPPYLVNACFDREDGFPIEQCYFEDFVQSNQKKRRHYAILLVFQNKDESNCLNIKTITYSMENKKFCFNKEFMFNTFNDISDFLVKKFNMFSGIKFPELKSDESDPESESEIENEVYTQYPRELENIQPVKQSNIKTTSVYFPKRNPTPQERQETVILESSTFKKRKFKDLLDGKVNKKPKPLCLIISSDSESSKLDTTVPFDENENELDKTIPFDENPYAVLSPSTQLLSESEEKESVSPINFDLFDKDSASWIRSTY